MASIQIAALGEQDVFFTTQPESSVFQYVYYKYINFSQDLVSKPLNNLASFGTSTYVIVDKKGHLLSKMYLSLTLPALQKVDGTYVSWTDTIGYAIFDGPIELQIGGIVVDRLYPHCLDMLNELTVSTNKRGLDRMILKSDVSVSSKHNADQSSTLLIPLNFWFTTDYSLALPLLSMNWQDIQINFSFKPFNEIINYDGIIGANFVDIIDSALLTEYIFLDDTVLEEFQSKEHLYVIEQQVYNGDEYIKAGISNFMSKLNFINPCKELLFACVDSNNIQNNNYFDYGKSQNQTSFINQIALLLDGKQRFNQNYLPECVFRELFPNNVHSVVPDKYIYTIPFALKPEFYGQPSGSLNLCRFDEVNLALKMNPGNNECQIYIFGIIHNIVRIANGELSFMWMN
jgi:hypothetical protein